MSDQAPLSRLDLNLLVSLDALLTERSVTRAAERLHLSQPALSASLARLRTHFNDPILARTGNSYELTPLASRLSEHTAAALDAARRVFDSQAEWDPSQSTREFAIYGSDYGIATTGRRLANLAAERAPGVRFRFMLHNPQIVEDAVNRLRGADGLFMPHGFLTDLPYTDLWTDSWVIVAAADNPSIGERPSRSTMWPGCHGSSRTSRGRRSRRRRGRSSSSASNRMWKRWSRASWRCRCSSPGPTDSG